MNMPVFRRSRVVVVSQSNRNCDIGFRVESRVFTCRSPAFFWHLMIFISVTLFSLYDDDDDDDYY